MMQRGGVLDEPASPGPDGHRLPLSTLVAEARKRRMVATVEKAEELRVAWLATVLPLAAVRRLRDVFDEELRKWPEP